MALSVTGSVLRIEKSSIHDGMGLRTVVFLKGCPLRCLWCSTPESQAREPGKGYNREKCTMCGVCIDACPAEALSADEAGGRIVTDKSRCVRCFACVKKCPASAMLSYGIRMTAKEVVAEIAKDEIFYYHSKGGVTLSGGEPLDQADFVREILSGCAAHGIHRAMETSFLASRNVVETILPHLELLYVDLKHIDPIAHTRITGAGNEIILENIVRAGKSRLEFGMIVRMPIIPGINDDDADIERAGAFIGGLGKVRAIEILPYHRLGTEAYRNLGMEYRLSSVAVPDMEYMEKIAAMLAAASNKPLIIGGVPYA